MSADVEARGHVVSTPEDVRASRRAVIASTVGTVIEWYDFGLYGIAAGLIFPTLFFPNSDPMVGVLNSFLVFGVGYVARPIGALVFGHYGDRLGRKGALLATVLMMGFGTFLVTFVPSYAHVGIWGAVCLCVLRFLQGLGVGGEWGGSVLVAMEWARPGRRGLFASWPQIGVPAGTLLANIVLALTSLATGSAFMDWGWRIPFALSAVMLVVGVYIRLGVSETPVFRRVVAERRVEKLPVLEALRKTWPQIILTSLLRMSELSTFIVFTVFVFTIGVQMLHYSRNFILVALLVGLAAECVVVPISGALSDRFGRKFMFILGVALSGLSGFLYFAGFASGSPVIIFLVIVLTLIPHGLQYGPEAALISENFTPRLRYSGSSIGYQLASILGGGPTPFIATSLLIRDPSGYLVAGYLLLCAVISIGAAAFMREGRHLDVAAEYDA
jgi:MFS family permease